MLGVNQANAGAPGAGPVFDVTEQTFERDVIARSREVPVVVDFWAPWCGPCRSLGPTLERLAAEAKGAWVLAKLNTDANQRLAQMFGIQSIPAVKAIKDGKIVDQFVGALPEGQVRAWLKRFVGEPGDDMVAMAQALEASDPQEAAARYRLILGEQPDNATALFNLGRLLLMQGEAEGVAALKQVPTASPLFARAQALVPLAEFFALAGSAPVDGGGSRARYIGAARSARAGDMRAALDDLLAIVMHDRAFGDDAARKTMLGLLAALGDDHPLTGEYRRKLANALF
jgi:putative thioredoxin